MVEKNCYVEVMAHYTQFLTKLILSIYLIVLHHTHHFGIHKWLLHKFKSRVHNIDSKLPYGHWNDVSNQRSFMTALAKELDITDPKSWENISPTVIMNYGAAGLLRKYKGSLRLLLEGVYPGYASN